MIKLRRAGQVFVMLSTIALKPVPVDRVRLVDAHRRFGSIVQVEVLLQAPGVYVSAISWQIQLPPGSLYVAQSTVADKTLSCSFARCVLYGGQTKVPNGLLATLLVEVPAGASSRLVISLDSVLGATVDGDERRLQGSSVRIDSR